MRVYRGFRVFGNCYSVNSAQFFSSSFAVVAVLLDPPPPPPPPPHTHTHPPTHTNTHTPTHARCPSLRAAVWSDLSGAGCEPTHSVVLTLCYARVPPDTGDSDDDKDGEDEDKQLFTRAVYSTDFDIAPKFVRLTICRKPSAPCRPRTASTHRYGDPLLGEGGGGWIRPTDLQGAHLRHDFALRAGPPLFF